MADHRTQHDRDSAELRRLCAERDKLRSFAMRFLSPEDLGWAVGESTRDEARIALGIRPVLAPAPCPAPNTCPGEGCPCELQENAAAELERYGTVVDRQPGAPTLLDPDQEVFYSNIPNLVFAPETKPKIREPRQADFEPWARSQNLSIQIASDERYLMIVTDYAWRGYQAGWIAAQTSAGGAA